MSTEHHGGLSQPSMQDDFDPNILSDDLNKVVSPVSSPSKNQVCQTTINLCAKSVLAHLVTHLGHFPMAIGAARLSSMVVEHDDVPNLSSDELSHNIFSAPNIQVSLPVKMKVKILIFENYSFLCLILTLYRALLSCQLWICREVGLQQVCQLRTLKFGFS